LTSGTRRQTCSSRRIVTSPSTPWAGLRACFPLPRMIAHAGLCVVVSVTGMQFTARDFFVGRNGTIRLASSFFGQFRGGSRQVDPFHAGGFTFLWPARTDFITLSQNLVVTMPQKFSMRIDPHRSLSSLLTVRRLPLWWLSYSSQTIRLQPSDLLHMGVA
jgi:hypothetical protein